MASLIKPSSAGFTLVEILVAISLLLVLAVGALSANTLTTTTITLNQRRSEANRLAREAMEALYAIRAADFVSLFPGEFHPSLTPSGWVLTPGSQVLGHFTRKIQLSAVQRDLACAQAVCDIIPGGGITDEGSLFAVVTVTWPEADGQQTFQLDSLITYWR